MDDETIDAQIQKELDAISLSSLDLNDDEVDEEALENVYVDDKIESVGTDTMQLFLEKSSARNKAAQDNINDAEDLLTMCNSVDQSGEKLLTDDTDYSIFLDTLLMADSSRKNVGLKTTTEIEEENRIKLEDLEEKLKQQEEDDNIQYEKKRISDEETLHQWENKETKMHKNVTVMLDKANYWEETYDQLAQEEFATKEHNLEKEYLVSQERIQLIQDEQKRILQNLLREKDELDRKRNKDAAVYIQKTFRGYTVRKKHGKEVQQRITDDKEKRRLERVAALEKKREEERAIQREKKEKEKKALSEKEKMKKPVIIKQTLKSQDPESISTKNDEKDVSMKSDSSNDPGNPTFIEMKEENSNESSQYDNKKDETKTLQRNSNFENLKRKEGSRLFQNGEEIFDNMKQIQANNLTLAQLGTFITPPMIDTEEENISGNNKSKFTTNEKSQTDRNVNSMLESNVEEEAKDDSHKMENINDKFDIKHPERSQHNFITGVNSQIITIVHSSVEIEASFSSELCQSNVEEEAKNDLHNINEKADIKHSNTLQDAENSVHHSFMGAVDNKIIPAVHSSMEMEASSSPELCQTILVSNFCSNEKEVTNTPNDSKIVDKNSFDDSYLRPDCTEFSDFPAESPVKNQDSSIKTHDTYPNMTDVEEKSNYESTKNDLNEDSIMVWTENFPPKIEKKSSGSVSENCIDPVEISPFSSNSNKENESLDISNHDIEKYVSFANANDNSIQNENTTNDANEKENCIISETDTVSETLKASVDETNTSQGNSEKSSYTDQSDTLHTPPKYIDKMVIVCDQTDSLIQTTASQQKKDSLVLSKNDNISTNQAQTVQSNVEDRSYADELRLHRNSWLKRLKFKIKKVWKSPTISKRRRLIRISSAAKRLSSFSDDEILDGSYFSTDCRVDKKVSDIEEAKCIVLRNIAGGRNLSVLTRCAYLSHLTVRNCGIVSVENLQSCPCLNYVDVSHNAINMISCSGMKRLEVLDLSHNHLTSIHGLEGCGGLLFLDFSNNNITKISGLEDTKSLLHLRLGENQVINASGIHCCENLLYLDISENHLVNLDDLENCKLLLSINASGNNLESLGQDFLDNMTLLTKLDVSRNSLQTLGLTEDTFLPFLTEFNASINRIASISETINFSLMLPFLSHMNLSKNLLSETENLKSLSSCQCVHEIDLADNPLALDSGDTDGGSFLRMMPEVITRSDKNSKRTIGNTAFDDAFDIFCPLYKFEKTFANLTNENSGESVLNIVSKQLVKLQSEAKKYSTEVQRTMIWWKGRINDGSNLNDAIHPPQMLIDHAAHLKKIYEMALYLRNVHENANMVYTPISGKQDNKLTLENKDGSTENTILAKDIRKRIPVPRDADTDSRLGVDFRELQTFKNNYNIYNKVKSASKTGVKSSIVYEKLMRRKESAVVEDRAATQIQAFWKGYRIQKRHILIKRCKLSAAIIIQAAWRGHQTRMKIQNAINLFKQTEPETQLQEEFEDVDLDGFDFDEKSFDEQWAYKVSGFDKMYSVSEEIATDDVPIFHNYRSNGAKQAFQKPVNYEEMGMAYSKPPLPPISSRTSTPLDTRLTLSELESKEPSIADSAQTKRSSKQEILTNEWGIKSSRTSDLMMRRARRMKGGRKKLQTANEKLLKFQEKTSVFQGSELSSGRKKQNSIKMEYFKAREQGYNTKNKISVEDDEQKRQYTFEWLHSQVGSNYDPHHKTSPPAKYVNPQPPQSTRTHSSGFLPVIPRSPSLVGVQDLEVVSVSSSSSYMNRSKERLRDIARRHNPSYTGQSH